MLITIRTPVSGALQGKINCASVRGMIPVVKKAAKAVGSVRLLAKRLCLYRGSLYQWVQVPEDHVLRIEELTGGKVTRYEMRPDIFGKKPKANEQHSVRSRPAA